MRTESSFEKKFGCDVEPKDKVTVAHSQPQDPWVVIDMRVGNDTALRRVLLTPKRARKMAKALRRAAKMAARNA